MKKRIPLLTLSGGRLGDFSRPVRYRIWVHYREDKDDGCYGFRSNELEKAKLFRKKLLKNKRFAIVEPIIAVVWDKKSNRYREVLNKQKKNRNEKAEKVWVICANPECSSCIVNAVYKDKEKAEKWVEEENRKLKFDLYWVEQSQLIRE